MTPKDLKKWRREHGYTQTELGELLGVTLVTVNRWENEAREIPSFLELALKSIPRKEGRRTRAAVSKRKRK